MKHETYEIGESRISAYVDFYKAPMAQMALQGYPDAEVTFELKNRRDTQNLLEHVNPEALQDRLDRFRDGWKPDEIEFLASQLRFGDQDTLFHDSFLNYLRGRELPAVNVSVGESGDLEVSTTGPWPIVTFWETVVMAEVNEMYFESFVQSKGLSLQDVYDEGDRRLTEKIAKLRAYPGIKFADFGTRRRFSYRWHKHVITRLVQECPQNIIGTSNIWLAHELGLKPIGTYAHEMPMVYAALYDAAGLSPMDGHRAMLLDWQAEYGENVSTALTDTFTSKFFFATFTKEQALQWRALRHDSGDPIAFGEQVNDFYGENDINPKDKMVVFSDGLDIDPIIDLYEYFNETNELIDGWGTTLTNDLGLPTLNIVMKAVRVNGQGTVKLSDDPGKEMGDPITIARYKRDIEAKLLQREVRLV